MIKIKPFLVLVVCSVVVFYFLSFSTFESGQVKTRRSSDTNRSVAYDTSNTSKPKSNLQGTLLDAGKDCFRDFKALLHREEFSNIFSAEKDFDDDALFYLLANIRKNACVNRASPTFVKGLSDIIGNPNERLEARMSCAFLAVADELLPLERIIELLPGRGKTVSDFAIIASALRAEESPCDHRISGIPSERLHGSNPNIFACFAVNDFEAVRDSWRNTSKFSSSVGSDVPNDQGQSVKVPDYFREPMHGHNSEIVSMYFEAMDLDARRMALTLLSPQAISAEQADTLLRVYLNSPDRAERNLIALKIARMPSGEVRHWCVLGMVENSYDGQSAMRIVETLKKACPLVIRTIPDEPSARSEEFLALVKTSPDKGLSKQEWNEIFQLLATKFGFSDDQLKLMKEGIAFSD